MCTFCFITLYKVIKEGAIDTVVKGARSCDECLCQWLEGWIVGTTQSVLDTAGGSGGVSDQVTVLQSQLHWNGGCTKRVCWLSHCIAYQDSTISGSRVARDQVRDGMDSAGGPDGHKIAWWSQCIT